MSSGDTQYEGLPPLARAEAMDRPYRPSRMPWLIGAGITVLLHIIFFSVKWATGPTEAHIQDLMKPDPRKPVIVGPAPVVYQNLRAPITPAAPRPSTPSPAAGDAPAK